MITGVPVDGNDANPGADRQHPHTTMQLALRIPDELAKELDELVAQGRFATRTEAVCSAICDLVERETEAH